eukprot:4941425-Karenia_brevis.AAC.1
MISVGAPPKDDHNILKNETCIHEDKWTQALQSMISVNEGFKIRGNELLPVKNREREWLFTARYFAG